MAAAAGGARERGSAEPPRSAEAASPWGERLLRVVGEVAPGDVPELVRSGRSLLEVLRARHPFLAAAAALAAPRAAPHLHKWTLDATLAFLRRERPELYAAFLATPGGVAWLRAGLEAAKAEIRRLAGAPPRP